MLGKDGPPLPTRHGRGFISCIEADLITLRAVNAALDRPGCRPPAVLAAGARPRPDGALGPAADGRPEAWWPGA